MPPGLLPTACLDRLSECVPTYRLGLEGPAADRIPRCGSSGPTNTENASLPRPQPKDRCGLHPVLVHARLRYGAACLQRPCVLLLPAPCGVAVWSTLLWSAVSCLYPMLWEVYRNQFGPALEVVVSARRAA